MELDSMIKKGKCPLTCLDVEKARKFEGKTCIFSHSYVNYKNIQEYMKNSQYIGVLEIDESLEHDDYIFKNANDGYRYCLVLPLEWIKEPEKKYRPYTLDEWNKEYHLGDIIIMRPKINHNIVYHKVFIEYSENSTLIYLGYMNYTLKELTEEYEVFKNGGWKPFGIEMDFDIEPLL